jgi:2-oxoisovalerate dehydrogenase E1 component beta subunit
MIEAVRLALRAAMAGDDRVVLLGEDVGALGGVFRASDGLLAEFGGDRVVDTPMAELSIVGVSIGMALRGLRPVAEIQFADFIYAAADQILSEAARYRFRTAGEWSVPLVIRTAWGAGIHGALYHSQSIEAVFGHFPGLKVVAASTPEDAAGLLLSAIADPDPVLVLEHKLAYRRVRGPVGDPPQPVPIGPARVARAGGDATVVAYGWMVHEALAAAEELAADDGLDVEVVDLRTLLPLDRAAVVSAARRTGRVCVVHEDVGTLGLGAEVAAVVGEECFDDLAAPVARVTMPDVAGTPYADGLEAALIPDARRIAASVRELVARRPRAPRPARSGGAAPPGGYHDPGVPQASLSVTASVDGLDGDRDLAALAVAAVARALLDEPEANGRFTDGGIVLNPSVHVLLLEPGEAGTRRLVVPAADELSTLGVERYLQRARTGVAAPPDAESTVSVVVAGGAALFGVPRVQEGHSVAVQVGAPHEAVVATGSGFEARRQVHVTVSADHRVLDGAGAGRVASAIKQRLESAT